MQSPHHEGYRRYKAGSHPGVRRAISAQVFPYCAHECCPTRIPVENTALRREQTTAHAEANIPRRKAAPARFPFLQLHQATYERP